MPKSNAQRVREAGEMHKAKGERQVKVWVPNNAEAIRQIRELAAKLRHSEEANPQGVENDDTGKASE